MEEEYGNNLSWRIADDGLQEIGQPASEKKKQQSNG